MGTIVDATTVTNKKVVGFFVVRQFFFVCCPFCHMAIEPYRSGDQMNEPQAAGDKCPHGCQKTRCPICDEPKITLKDYLTCLTVGAFLFFLVALVASAVEYMVCLYWSPNLVVPIVCRLF